ncbi:MAG: hypothetical protein ACI9QD_000636 [Thermoproteota archaeon]|jgi:hypothetical protein
MFSTKKAITLIILLTAAISLTSCIEIEQRELDPSETAADKFRKDQDNVNLPDSGSFNTELVIGDGVDLGGSASDSAEGNSNELANDTGEETDDSADNTGDNVGENTPPPPPPTPTEPPVFEEELPVAENQITPFDNSSLYADFIQDSNGFGPWKIGSFRSSPFDDYVGGALDRCVNGSTRVIRDCFALGDASQCIGAIEKHISCDDLDLNVPTYSAWTKAVVSNECTNGSRSYSRQCISLGGSTPKCFGPSSFTLECNSSEESKLAKINETFTKTTDCFADDEAHNHFRTLCSGDLIPYSGKSEKYLGCFIDENGQTTCPQQAPDVKWCFVSQTICSSQITDNMLPDTTYLNTESGGYCGLLAGSSADPNRDVGFGEYEIGSMQALLGEVQECGTGNHAVEKAGCRKEKKMPKCLMNIGQVENQNHKDTSCIGSISNMVSCEHGSSYAFLNTDGAWSDWRTVTGCHMNSEQNQVVKIQERKCEGTRRAGQYCQDDEEGGKLRYVQCTGGVNDGITLKLLVDSDLTEDSTLMAKINQYKDIGIANGAAIEVQSVNTSSMSVVELRALVNDLTVNGSAPKLVSLIGSFPYPSVALLANQTFSSSTTETYSDLPLMLENQNVYNYANGLYEYNTSVQDDDAMTYARIVFRTDFSNHNLTRSGMYSQLSKYQAYFDKVIAHHQGGSISFPSSEVKINLLTDEDWDHSMELKQITVNSKINAAYGDNMTKRAGWLEIFAQPAAYGAFHVHGNGEYLGFSTYGGLPSNGHDLNTNLSNPKITQLTNVSIFNSIDVKVPVLKMFNCYSLSPDVESNVGTSFLLGQNSDVVAAVGAYASGAQHQWAGSELTNSFITGDTFGKAVLRWTSHQIHGTSVVHKPMSTMNYNTEKWHINVGYAGDPLARAKE